MSTIVVGGKRVDGGKSNSGQLQLTDPLTLTVKGQRVVGKMVRVSQGELLLPPSVVQEWKKQGLVQ